MSNKRMEIITKKLYVPMTVVPGVKTYRIYPLQFIGIYVDDVLSYSGMAPAGAMELPADINEDADCYAAEEAPGFDPEFVQINAEIATRVEM